MPDVGLSFVISSFSVIAHSFLFYFLVQSTAPVRVLDFPSPLHKAGYFVLLTHAGLDARIPTVYTHTLTSSSWTHIWTSLILMIDADVACLPISVAQCWVFCCCRIWLRLLRRRLDSPRLASKNPHFVIRLLHSFPVGAAFYSDWTLMRFLSYLFGLLGCCFASGVARVNCKCCIYCTCTVTHLMKNCSLSRRTVSRHIIARIFTQVRDQHQAGPRCCEEPRWRRHKR